MKLAREKLKDQLSAKDAEMVVLKEEVAELSRLTKEVERLKAETAEMEKLKRISRKSDDVRVCRYACMLVN